MGLIKAIMGAAGGVLADQWLDFFYCESIDTSILATKGKKRTSKRGSNTKGDDNIISNGSKIAVNDGQCMIIVEQGKIVDVCAEPGEYTYDQSSEPSIFYGKLGENIKNTFLNIGKRFTFGGDPGKDQRIYFFNTKEIVGNKYGTASPVPFRVVDRNIGLDIDISIRCNGEFSYKIADPLLFYTNVCGNIREDYNRNQIDSMLKTELLTALQPAFARLSEMGIRYSALPGHTIELSDALNEVLSNKWTVSRGLKVASFGVNSVTASKEDEDLIKQLQRTAVMRDPNMAAASLVGAQSDAMKSAASNKAGAMTGFMGFGMAQQAGGMNAQDLFNMGQQRSQQQAQYNQQPSSQPGQQNYGQSPSTQNQNPPASNASLWTCPCGTQNSGKFCLECGSPKPAQQDGWTCTCGTVNKGKFCAECGKQKPAEEPPCQCSKCGWMPESGQNPPKFCPECGNKL